MTGFLSACDSASLSSLLSSEVTAFKGAQLICSFVTPSGLSLLPLEFTLLLLEPLLFPDKDPFEQGPQSGNAVKR